MILCEYSSSDDKLATDKQKGKCSVVVICIPNKKVKGQRSHIAPNERTHLGATERHLSYGITQCYLPPDRVERALP